MTHDPGRLEYIEIVPLTRATTECDSGLSGDWSAQVKQEHLPVVKQEPHDVCFIIVEDLLYLVWNAVVLISLML